MSDFTVAGMREGWWAFHRALSGKHEKRYRLSLLVEASGKSESALAREVGLSGTSLQWARRVGLVEAAADRYAVRVGLVPWLVWPDWLSDLEQSCAEPRCLQRFVPRDKRQRFCSHRCADRAAQRRRRQNPSHREKEAQYLAEYRSGERAKAAARATSRRYYREHRDELLAKQRTRDRARRTAAGVAA